MCQEKIFEKDTMTAQNSVLDILSDICENTFHFQQCMQSVHDDENIRPIV